MQIKFTSEHLVFCCPVKSRYKCNVLVGIFKLPNRSNGYILVTKVTNAVLCVQRIRRQAASCADCSSTQQMASKAPLRRPRPPPFKLLSPINSLPRSITPEVLNYCKYQSINQSNHLFRIKSKNIHLTYRHCKVMVGVSTRKALATDRVIFTLSLDDINPINS